MTYWLICNSKAGAGERGQRFWLDHLAAAGIRSVECCDLDDPELGNKLGAKDTLIVAGGDGTVNRGAALCRGRGATLAILPSGTANDFARNLGLPGHPDAVCRLIAEGTTQQVDVADYGSGIFLNVAHVGIGTLPARKSQETEKKLLGRFSYIVELMRWLNAKRGFRATIRCDRQLVKGRWLSIAVANGAFFGGGNIIPESSANDGQLDIVAVRPRSIAQLFFTFLMVRINKQSPRRTSTLVQIKGEACSVYTGKPKTVTADGDVVSKTPLNVSCNGKSLRVIGPEVISSEAAHERSDGIPDGA